MGQEASHSCRDRSDLNLSLVEVLSSVDGPCLARVKLAQCCDRLGAVISPACLRGADMTAKVGRAAAGCRYRDPLNVQVRVANVEAADFTFVLPARLINRGRTMSFFDLKYRLQSGGGIDSMAPPPPTPLAVAADLRWQLKLYRVDRLPALTVAAA